MKDFGLAAPQKRQMHKPIRIAVTGSTGQVVRCLAEVARNDCDVELIRLGRPHLDLACTRSIAGAMREVSPDLVVNAAAYTAVDLAESDPVLAYKVNAIAPKELARAAKEMAVPIIHLSTDYVFDGAKSAPYVESDSPFPLGVYGHSKLQGERAVAAMTDNHAILRTAWLYSPFGRNFLTTMLSSAENISEIPVVADQIGNPTSALDLATAILKVGRNLLGSDDNDIRGVFHLAGTGDASWADFALEIFYVSKLLRGPFAKVKRISSEEYRTIARRPRNSRLNCRNIQENHGVLLPDWRRSTVETVKRLIRN